ncbi:glucose-1-phosphate thymidylyltransferase RfbA [Granulosicoccus sp. 3-233]|uniref:glucose-1-phosphate thymidylyltransferase RfbA n=1 Tax=Granulosicoccus sp. 3-233 TaxID=3417969 RepID=UPI003D332600
MSCSKGIILAGGTGSRLFPVTKGMNKHLLPVYDKPMIYFPVSTLMLAGIRKILLITNECDLDNFKRLLGDGSWLGISIEYAIQDSPNGLAEAFLIGREFIGEDSVALHLGDNVFYGQGFHSLLEAAAKKEDGASIFAYHVKDPKRFGIVEFDEEGRVISLEEKPENPRSSCAVVGLYFYDNDVVSMAESIKPSSRGELEITDINRLYLEMGKLSCHWMGRGFAWLDTGTHESLMQASNFIHTIEERQGLKVACLEEIACLKGFISKSQAKDLASRLPESTRDYLFERIDALDGESRHLFEHALSKM